MVTSMILLHIKLNYIVFISRIPDGIQCDESGMSVVVSIIVSKWKYVFNRSMLVGVLLVINTSLQVLWFTQGWMELNYLLSIHSWTSGTDAYLWEMYWNSVQTYKKLILLCTMILQQYFRLHREPQFFGLCKRKIDLTKTFCIRVRTKNVWLVITRCCNSHQIQRIAVCLKRAMCMPWMSAFNSLRAQPFCWFLKNFYQALFSLL